MITVTAIHERLWKVSDGGALTGYVDAIDARDGIRYRARRLNTQNRRWSALGEYWELALALQALGVAPASAATP